MNRKWGQKFTIDDRRTFKKVLGADEGKVCRNQNLENNNKDATFDCRSGFGKSEKINTIYIYIVIVVFIWPL